MVSSAHYRVNMYSLRVLFFLSLAFSNTAVASPLSKLATHAPPEIGGSHRRGVAYNEAKFVKYFDVDGSQVTWVCLEALICCQLLTPYQAYNWDSHPGGDLNAWFEYVPMLHSNRPDHTGKWSGDVQAAAFANKNAPTHLLGFNEPDNCQ